MQLHIQLIHPPDNECNNAVMNQSPWTPGLKLLLPYQSTFKLTVCPSLEYSDELKGSGTLTILLWLLICSTTINQVLPTFQHCSKHWTYRTDRITQTKTRLCSYGVYILREEVSINK